jgi:hypothetical protein
MIPFVFYEKFRPAGRNVLLSLYYPLGAGASLVKYVTEIFHEIDDNQGNPEEDNQC